MSEPLPSRAATGREVYPFFALALAITWLLDLPYVLACIRNDTPPPYALPLTGLGALGPTLAALVIAGYRRELGHVFGRFRAAPRWILVALLLPFPIHLVANLVERALGGHPSQWLYLPVEPERVVAMVVFPLGEEFGWRGFAYPRLAERHGPVVGSLILGAFWGLWHLGMMFLPGQAPDPWMVLAMMAELAVWSVLWAWVFERANRSMTVAVALHVGAHLDNIYRMPPTELRLRVIVFLVVSVAAAFAARSLLRKGARDRSPT